MSRQEVVIGKLKPTGQTVEQYMEGVTVSEYYNFPDDLLEAFYDKFYQNAEVINGEVYEVVDRIEPEGADMYHSTKLSDGSISFAVSYYNGGCSFSEAIHYALKCMESKEKNQ